MKTYQTITLLILFSTSLLSGILVGRRVGGQFENTPKNSVRQLFKPRLSSIKAMGEQSPEDSQILDNPPSEPTATHQRNILIVGVDNLDAYSPRLKSVWLIIYLEDSPHLMLLPIYPAESTQSVDTQPSDRLETDFKLTPQRQLNTAFLMALNKKEIWWTGHIIVDEYALADVVDFVARANDDSHLDGAKTIQKIPASWDAPLGSLIGQADLLKILCHYTTGLSSVPRWKYLQLFAVTQDHFSTDYDAEAALDEWQNLLSRGGGISCEFPSMSVPRPRP